MSGVLWATGLGDALALVGVGLFFGTAGLVAVERVDLAASSVAAAMVMVALGIALTTASLRPTVDGGLALGGVGAVLVGVGGISARRRARVAA
jgi:hypothetical protein